MQKTSYENPLCSRYASRQMQHIFSPDMRYSTWRRLWVALAEAEMELGLPISPEQVEQLRAHVRDIDYDVVRERENEVRHDVMAHVYAYGKVCPRAAGIIHLGATSCYVTDNADIILYREALRLVREKLLEVLRRLSAFALEYKALPALGYTHLQPAQLVTVGKRACLWMQDLALDVELLDFTIAGLKLRGVKGTTGTQASFLYLFEGDHEKVKELERRVIAKMDFDAAYPVTGQTYSRKVDFTILAALSSVAQSACKFATDLRILMANQEIEEPFSKTQIGSSAMAYKRNPMRSERICSLARHVIALAGDPAMTASTQWMERTLDDSANRRICMPEAFLATDALLEIYANVTSGLVVYDKVIARRVAENLPFMATENIMMEAVRKGGDRQQLHERIRVHSHAAAAAVKLEGKPNDLLARIAADDAFPFTLEQLQALLDPAAYTGRSARQVEEFVEEVIAPLLATAQGAELSGVSV